MPDLRTAVIIDYQNVHLTGAGVFEPYQPPHEHLVHPLHFANQIITCRSAKVTPQQPSPRSSFIAACRRRQ